MIAVNNLSITIDEGQVLCILGSNGAGKTTTINMLTGLLRPTSGEAMIYGHSVTEEQDDIRKIMGICPQHDILWDELTAAEHLELFAEFRGISTSQVKKLVDDKLKEVELLHVRDHRSKTFSGGMKRRLSVAISSIADPKIVFFDEPVRDLYLSIF
jgi:ABC-type multidrug transport system ATPase subunit